MSDKLISLRPLNSLNVLERLSKRRAPISFNLEITARCNNNCRHCYINLTEGDKDANSQELSLDEIERISEEAVSMGAVWCLITGGEPLLRNDFSDIYLSLKKLGLLVSVFTNACLISKDHVELFRRYPPRTIEVSVYGITKETYERVTRKQGSFEAFINGINLLIDGGIKVRLKAMALRSNVCEFPEIARFCRRHTVDFYRFDPMLHLRFDGDKRRNREIEAERLSPDVIAALERGDEERFSALKKNCDQFILNVIPEENCGHLFRCGAGTSSFNVSYNGIFRLCSSLWHPECVYDLRKGCLQEAWNDLVPKTRGMHSNSTEFLEKCSKCALINLCLWCPGRAFLENGKMDSWVEYFCEIAHARAEQIPVIPKDHLCEFK
jgi:radical SAM protein with 4Fe4S-binding SPASM domain